MLEVLKQLQVKPPVPVAQVEICNQKYSRDCHFLRSYIFAPSSYITMSIRRIASKKRLA